MTTSSPSFGFKNGDMVAGRYEILSAIGAGGSAQVYRVRDHALNDDQVALKLLNPDLVGSAEQEARLRSEVLLARRLGHPNIVQVYDLGATSEGFRFITMEWIDGTTLFDHIAALKEQRLELSKAIYILSDVASALEAAHRKKIIHRDIKPENIFLTITGEVKLGDFGAARSLNEQKRITKQGSVIGTLGYMAPEQLAGAPIDERVDVFALGILAYEITSSDELPWDMTDVAALMRQMRLNLPGLNNQPWWFQNFVETCTEFDREKRFANMTEVRKALESCRRKVPRIAEKLQPSKREGGFVKRMSETMLSRLRS